jgi:hypothetical protein
VFASYLAGIVSPFLLAAMSSHESLRLMDAYRETADFLSIFPKGYGGLAQDLYPSLLIYLVMAITVAAYGVRTMILRRSVTPLSLFCLFSLALSGPHLIQAMNRGPNKANVALWVVLPCFLILVSRLARAARRSRRSFQAGAVAAALLCILAIGNPVNALIDKLRILTVRQEPVIHAWALRCAAAKRAGAPCEPVAPFTLRGLFEKELEFPFERTAGFRRMVAECRDGAVIVDVLDAFVHRAGNCPPHHRYPAFFSLSTRRQMEDFVDVLSASERVYFGETPWGFQQRLLTDIREAWLARRRASTTCDASLAALAEVRASALSDPARSRGIGLGSNPSVLLDRDRGILCHLRPGMGLAFAGSGERLVRAVSGDTVQLLGSPLDPVLDGFPRPIRVNFNLDTAALSRLEEAALAQPIAVDDAFFVTDDNWVRGISRRSAGFFLPNRPEVLDAYKPGRYVTFADGQSRRIERADASGAYVNVHVEGEPLDAARVGLPSRFAVSSRRDKGTKAK